MSKKEKARLGPRLCSACNGEGRVFGKKCRFCKGKGIIIPKATNFKK